MLIISLLILFLEGNQMTQFLEAMMLTAFSVGWYCSIYRTLRVRQVTGKSLGFVVLIGSGYLCGVASKCVLWVQTGDMPTIIYLYSWNAAVIAFDAWLVIRYSRTQENSNRSPEHLVPTLPK